jgi:hypothetical protein
MCTLTVVPLPGRLLRVAFNRDEQRTRSAGIPPRVGEFEGRRAVFPTDPPSGGTWLAVTDVGLVLAVLNVNRPYPPDRTPSRSRGDIIPALLGTDTPADALTAFERQFTYADFAPFRLVLVGHGILAEVRWDGHEPMVTSRLLGGTPLLFTSSGLGDYLVEGVRRELFDDLFAGPLDGWEVAQDEFHRHRWPGREHLSVNMERADARTVSHAVIDLGDAGATFTYHPDAPDRPVERHAHRLSFTPAGVS